MRSARPSTNSSSCTSCTIPSHSSKSTRSTCTTKSRTTRTSNGTTRPPTRNSAMSRRRPPTGVSRVGGAQNIICAITESRGVSPTIGLCFVNTTTGECILCELCDTQTYVRTVHKLHVYEPNQILFLNTSISPCKSKLVSIVEEELLDSTLVPIPRKYYNEQTGHSYIKGLAFEEDIEALGVAITAKYYSMSAVAAALKFIELELGMSFAPNSLRINFQPSEGSMLIDFSTVLNLELIQNIQNPQATDSLFGLLNSTLTAMGARLLRSNILQPHIDKKVINDRLDAVEEFTRNEEMFYSLRSALKNFLDMDRLLTAIITIPLKVTMELKEQAINNIIILKQSLASVSPIRESLTGARSNLLVTIRKLCSADAIQLVQDMIDRVINQDVTWSKSPLDLRNQRCYAVKSGVNGLLDVARQTYKEATEDVYQLVQELSEQHNLGLELKFENSRGYYLKLSSSELEDRVLPTVFINVVERKKMLEFTTLELIKRNAKIKDSLTEVLLMSDKTVMTLMDDVRSEVSALFKLAEGIAVLDMILAFCNLAITYDYVRPEFTDTLAIKAGRHPLREKIHKFRYIPNDVYASTESRFQIITGCNMSGKSTYIRSIALMCVMAQIGAFVPAQYASFPTFSQLFARVSMDDGLEANASTFALEMRETAFILRNVTKGSLIIMDELGRGTSTRDGLAIALSVCEVLVKSGAFIWFATHFRDLAAILGECSGVVNLHMQVEVGQNHQVTMLYKISDGTAEEEHYGLALAKLVELPPDVLERANIVSETLAKNIQEQKKKSNAHLIAKRRRLVLQLKELLIQLKEGRLDGSNLQSILSHAQEEFVTHMDALRGVKEKNDVEVNMSSESYSNEILTSKGQQSDENTRTTDASPSKAKTDSGIISVLQEEEDSDEDMQ